MKRGVDWVGAGGVGGGGGGGVHPVLPARGEVSLANIVLHAYGRVTRGGACSLWCPCSSGLRPEGEIHNT